MRQQLPDAPCAILLRSPEEASVHCVAERGLADEHAEALAHAIAEAAGQRL